MDVKQVVTVSRKELQELIIEKAREAAGVKAGSATAVIDDAALQKDGDSKHTVATVTFIATDRK